MTTLSNRTLRALSETLSAWSALTPIGHLFEDSGITLPPPEIAAAAAANVSGQRRGLTAQYLASLNLRDPNDTRKLLAVFDEVLASVVPADGPEAGRARSTLLRLLSEDGFAPGPDGRFSTAVMGRIALPLDRIEDVEVLQEHLDRIDREVETDPSGAISATKALIESTAKIVLREMGKLAGTRPSSTSWRPMRSGRWG